MRELRGVLCDCIDADEYVTTLEQGVAAARGGSNVDPNVTPEVVTEESRSETSEGNEEGATLCPACDEPLTTEDTWVCSTCALGGASFGQSSWNCESRGRELV